MKYAFLTLCLFISVEVSAQVQNLNSPVAKNDKGQYKFVLDTDQTDLQVIIEDPIGMLGSIRVSGLWHQFFGEPIEDYSVTWRHGNG